jgi:nitrate/nitrite-specific signal transduction histidine kinase
VAFPFRAWSLAPSISSSTSAPLLFLAASQVVLRVEDDGDGFDQSVQPGVGLRSMRERAAELGGRFTVARAQSGGAIVEVRLPLSEEQP